MTSVELFERKQKWREICFVMGSLDHFEFSKECHLILHHCMPHCLLSLSVPPFLLCLVKSRKSIWRASEWTIQSLLPQVLMKRWEPWIRKMIDFRNERDRSTGESMVSEFTYLDNEIRLWFESKSRSESGKERNLRIRRILSFLSTSCSKSLSLRSKSLISKSCWMNHPLIALQQPTGFSKIVDERWLLLEGRRLGNGVPLRRKRREGSKTRLVTEVIFCVQMNWYGSE